LGSRGRVRRLLARPQRGCRHQAPQRVEAEVVDDLGQACGSDERQKRPTCGAPLLLIDSEGKARRDVRVLCPWGQLPKEGANDDRIYALISIIGIALLIFGLLESELRKALHAADPNHDKRLPLLPEDRLAKPTGASILSAFQGLHLTYTHRGIELDPLTPTQQRILDLLRIQPPWPQRDR
jgi:hypothetical protein